VQGPTTITVSNVQLEQILFFAPAGAILPLAPVVQYSDALPGGPLTVYVFPGADGSFVVYEDDGETNTYTTDASALRKITLSWSSAKSTLTWAVNGSFADTHTFTQIRAVLADPKGSRSSFTSDIGTGGAFTF
jgi:alpha-glucosidase (family GH31 glycosyl hydrolase)